MDSAAASWVSQAKGLIDPAMRGAVAELDPRNRLVAEYHLGYVDAEGAPADMDGGKTIRGALALLSARVAGADAEDGIPAAVAVELVHHHSLLHDDIIDRDRTRRHRLAAWTVFGTPAAILAGDALAARATGVLAAATAAGVTAQTRLVATTILTRATERMLAGQAADIAFETSETVTMDECRAMVADKTGALLAAAASMGAALVGGDDDVVSALHRFGHHLGMAFQFADDLLGVWGDPAATGKPAAADLAARKKSLPVVAALEAGGAHAATISQIYAKAGALTDVDLRALSDAIESAGARRWAQDQAAAETDAAFTLIDALAIPADVADDLRALTMALGHRDA